MRRREEGKEMEMERGRTERACVYECVSVVCKVKEEESTCVRQGR